MTEHVARLEEMNEEERRLTLAAEQLFGRRLYETSYLSPAGEKVNRVSPIPPRAAF